MKLIHKCSICNKPLIVVEELMLDDTTSLYSYKCGHSFIKETDKSKKLDFTSADGTKTARGYQKQGIEFIVNSGFNAIIADQMRLGKTPQSLLALKNYYAERTPVLIIVKSANLWQWVREYKSWTDTLPLGIWIIEGTKSFIPQGFSAYIISMDTIGRRGPCSNCKHSGSRHNEDTDKCSAKGCECEDYKEESSIIGTLLEFGFKLVIVDEAHSFKNTESKRTQALVRFLKQISVSEIERVIMLNCTFCHHSWKESTHIKLNLRGPERSATARHDSKCPQCGASTAVITRKDELDLRNNACGIIMLTGTPIKNRADEYFVPLNIVAPEWFPSLASFRRNWCIQDDKGVYSRIHPYRLAQFQELTKKFLIRREKEDVYTDLPKLNRMFTVIDIEDQKLKDAYNKVLDRLEEEMEHKNFTFFDSIAELTLLRQICGVAKVDWTSDYLEASLLDNNLKYAVGLHHHAVKDLLVYKCAHLGISTLTGSDNAERKDYIMRSFETAPERVLAINMLAGGVGMDFHYIHNVLILERQWSSADEEQFEFRFYNPDKSIMGENQTDIEYILAKSTIDEWFYDLVERKRRIFGETLGSSWNLASDTGSFRDLMEKTVGSRL